MASVVAHNHSKSVVDIPQPKMLRVGGEIDPERLGMAHRSEIGQAFEWALDQCRIEKKQASGAMGFSHQGVISEWISGRERIQLDKLKQFLPAVYSTFMLVLLEACEGVEVRTQVTIRRVG